MVYFRTSMITVFTHAEQRQNLKQFQEIWKVRWCKSVCWHAAIYCHIQALQTKQDTLAMRIGTQNSAVQQERLEPPHKQCVQNIKMDVLTDTNRGTHSCWHAVEHVQSTQRQEV